MLHNLRRPAAQRFDGVEMDAVDGAAFVRGALAMIAATQREAVRAGDHTLVLLEVTSLHRDHARRPLVFFDSAIHTLTH